MGKASVWYRDSVMNIKTSESFRSYINLDCHLSNGNASSHAAAAGETLRPLLLPGETEVASADQVLLFHGMHEQQPGVTGSLFVTNFKLSFVTTLSDTAQLSIGPRRNLLLSANDLCLLNIDGIYQLMSSAGRKKSLTPHSNIAGRIKGLQIRCKDFRVVNFSFKFSPLNADRAIANALLMYCYPRVSHLLFVFDYKHVGRDSRARQNMSVHDFNSSPDWLEEMNRTGVVGWRTSLVNERFFMSHSLPEIVVVPKCLSDAEVLRCSSHFVESRPPVWCWGREDGTAIVRSAYTLPSIRNSDGERVYLDAIRSCHPSGSEPHQLDVGARCPSLEELHESYCKLRELCVPESMQLLSDSDSRWLGLLSASRWPQAVTRCLTAALECVDKLTKLQTSVILYESSGRDLTAVVSSLAQLLLDPECRRLTGFQRLVDKEWIALGHPFQHRHALVHEDDAVRSPVFLLFLDCVYQLLMQFPGQFEFTDVFLVSVWDATLVSACDTFLFNCHKQRFNAVNGKDTDYLLQRRSVWDWSHQLSAADQQLFLNPLYQLSSADGGAPTSPTGGGSSRSRPSGYNLLAQVTRSDSALVAERRRYQRPLSASLRLQLPLLPQVSVAHFRLWTLCYCRWVPSLNVARGGLAAEQARVRQLQRQVEALEARLDAVRAGVGLRRRGAARTSAADSPDPDSGLPNSLHPFLVSDAPGKLLCVTPGFVSNLVRNSIAAAVEDDDDARRRVPAT